MTARRHILPPLLLCLSFLCADPVLPQDSPVPAPMSVPVDRYARFRAHLPNYIAAVMKKSEVKSIGYAFVDDQETVLAAGFGLAREKEQVPAGEETVYQAGGISRVFTSLALLKLVEEGKLDLDQPLETYLAEWAPRGCFPVQSPVTARQLLDSHAGLPSDYLPRMFSRTKTLPFTDYAKALLASINSTPLAAQPGTAAIGGDAPFGVAGALLERVGGVAFADAVDRILIKPAGMTDTVYEPRPDMAQRLATGFYEGKEADMFRTANLAAEGILTTPRDMAQLMKVIFAGGVAGGIPLLKPETIAGMLALRDPAPPLDGDLRMGLGWYLGGYEAITGYGFNYPGPLAWQGGDTLQHKAVLLILPAEKLGVIVFASGAEDLRPVMQIAMESMRWGLAAKGRSVPRSGAPASQPAETVAAPASLERYAGLYGSEYLGSFPVAARGEKLMVKVDMHHLGLIPVGEGIFTLKYYVMGLIPMEVNALKRYRVIIRPAGEHLGFFLEISGKQYLFATRVEKAAVPEAWMKIEGEYRAQTDPDEVPLLLDPRVEYDDGHLYLTARWVLIPELRMRYALRPLSDTEAVIMGVGRNLGVTVRMERAGKKVTLHLLGMAFERK